MRCGGLTDARQAHVKADVNLAESCDVDLGVRWADWDSWGVGRIIALRGLQPPGCMGGIASSGFGWWLQNRAGHLIESTGGIKLLPWSRRSGVASLCSCKQVSNDVGVPDVILGTAVKVALETA